ESEKQRLAAIEAQKAAAAKAEADLEAATSQEAVEARERAAAAAAKHEYVVKSGDSLSKIAKELYGDAKRWPEIYEANKALIGDNPNLIHPGQKLVIP
ncbi:MAG TPA: LysM peptidoglycan-binding domain-containing protein, partial [Anaerolineae bacterium]|nr:LysM peptidoglycan-binding domain-containing protein [Anaerolineae bacterium]